MSYRSKRTIVSMISAALILIAFAIYIFSAIAPAVEDLRAWALTLLVFIGISVAAQIVIQIVFHIAVSIGITIKEGEADAERILESEMLEDERDKRINDRSSKGGYTVVGAGFIANLVLLALGHEPSIALGVLFASFFIGSFVEGCISIYLEERDA